MRGFVVALALVACAVAVERSSVMHRVRTANISLADENTVVFADMPRFAQAQATAEAATQGDFDLPEPLGGGPSVAEGGTFEGGVDVAKFITKIKSIDEKMIATRKGIKEAIKGCEKVSVLKGVYTSLSAERDRVSAQKRKKILQTKLDKQNSDLNVIDRMADNLRDRFSELRQTQSTLRSNIQGTAEDLQNVMGATSKPPAGPAKSPLANDMYDTHGEQVEGVKDVQDINLNKLVGFFKNALKMPIDKPGAAAAPAPAAKAAVAAPPAKGSL